jgi:hypothetical protein
MSNQLPTEYSRLLSRHILRSLSENEREELEKHVEESDDLMYVFEQVTDPNVYYKAKELLDPVNLSTALDRVKSKGQGRAKFATTTSSGISARVLQLHRWPKPYKVAAGIAAIGLAAFLISINSGRQKVVLARTDIKPGKGEVHQSVTVPVIKDISDSVLNLTDIREGSSIENGGFITSMNNGRLKYKLTKAGAAARSHTLVIPTGNTATVTLPDESNVLLNALSSMKVVSSASGALRIIITGEAFIESSTHSSSHLTLEVKDRMTIEVAEGTHMNVNAYNDEPTVSASILSGSGESRITAGGKTALLSMNQEARFRGNSKSDSLIIVNMDAIAIDATKAWKEGLFDLRSTNLETIMRQMSRWYNVDVVYEGNAIPTRNFGASLRRDTNLNDMIKVLRMNGVDVKLQGKKLMLAGN